MHYRSRVKSPAYTRKIYTPRPLSKRKLFCGTRKAELIVSPRPANALEPYKSSSSYNNNTQNIINSDKVCSSSDSIYNNDITLTTIIDKLQDSSW